MTSFFTVKFNISWAGEMTQEVKHWLCRPDNLVQSMEPIMEGANSTKLPSTCMPHTVRQKIFLKIDLSNDWY